MARIRTIKPEFWKHEDLSELPEATHMLAAALLNYADDEGYFNANPKLIQAELFPLREPSVTIHGSLTELARIGYLRLGTSSDGKRYGHVVNFLDHQKVSHGKDSKIKELDIAWEDSVKLHGSFTEASPPEGNREQGIEQGTGNREGNAPALRATSPPDDPLNDPVGLMVAEWDHLAEECGLSKVSRISPERRSKAKLRFKELGGMDGWREALNRIRGSPFCLGQNDRGWRADFDFLMSPKSLTRLMEDFYAAKGPPADPTVGDVIERALGPSGGSA